MDPSRNQFFPNNFQGNISNQLNHLNQGSNVNLMQTLSQLSNLANSNLNSTPMGQDMLNRGYLSHNLGNQYLNNAGLNNGMNWNQQQSQDWLDTAKVAAMYNIIQSSVNPTNVNNQFGSPTNFLSTPSSNLFNQPRTELPSIPNAEISMFSNQTSASLTPNIQNSLADNGFGTYSFNPLPSTSASQNLQSLSQQIDTDALSEFLDIRSNDFLAGSSSLGSNFQEFENLTYNREPLLPKTSFQSATSLSYNNDLPTTYAESVTQNTTSQRNDDPMIGSQHFDQSPCQTSSSRTPKQQFEGASSSRFQENSHLFNEDLSNIDLLDLAEKLNKYEEDINAGSDTRQEVDSQDINVVNSATPYDEYLAAPAEQTSHQNDNWSTSRPEQEKGGDNQTHRATESQEDYSQPEATQYASQSKSSRKDVNKSYAIEEDPDAMPENFLEEPMERKSSMEMADGLSVSVNDAKPQSDSSAVVSEKEINATSEAPIKSSAPKEAVVTKDEEVDQIDQTGTALIDFLNGMAGGTERDSPEPMTNPSFEPVQFTPPDSPTGPAVPSFQQPVPFSSFSTFAMTGFAPSANLEPQPSSSKLVSFLPEIKSEINEPLLSNNMFNVKKNELRKELPKKIPIYKQDMDLKEEKEDKKKAGGNVYDFDEDEFDFDLKPTELKFKKDEPISTKRTLPTSVYNPIKPKAHSSNSSKTKPLKIKIRPIEPPPDNTTCIQVLQKELEASSEPIKISPFGDIDISINPTPKAWRWDSDPNENTKLEVVVKEEDQSERPSLKLTIKMTKKEPTSYFEEPEEKSRKRRKLSESEDEEDEYLPSACRKHRKKKKRRTSFKEIDPLDDFDRVSQCSSSESHPVSVRRNSIIDPFKNANLLDDDAKYKYLALERTENNTKGDFVVDKSDLINSDPEDICIWRIEKQVKLKFEPCDEEFSGLYAMTDHYAVWYDEMMSNCVKINCEYISQAKNCAIIKPLYPLAQLFSAIPVDAEESVLMTGNGVTNDLEELNEKIFNIVIESVEIFIREAVFPGFLESNGKTKSHLQPLNQFLALKEDVLNNHLERFELLQPFKDKILSFNRMVMMNENNSLYGSLCENCESDREIVMFHLFNAPKGLLNIMEKVDVQDDEEIDREDGDVEEFSATTLVLCSNCKDPIYKIHSIKHCADHLLDECRREIVGMCLNSPTKWQKIVHKEMIGNKIFIEKVSKKYTKILDSDIE